MKLTKLIILKREKRRVKREYKLKLKQFKDDVIRRDSCVCCICRKVLIEPKSRHVHHILPNCPQYKYLSTDIRNGILLCPRCHRLGPNSVHQNSLYMSYWLQNNRPEQYIFLIGELLKFETKN